MGKSRCFSTLVYRPSRKLFFNKLKKTMNEAAAPEHDDLWNGGSRPRVPSFLRHVFHSALQSSSGFQGRSPLTPQRPCSVAMPATHGRLRAAHVREMRLGYRMSAL